MKFLDREATIAKPGFNRWLVPPAAAAAFCAVKKSSQFAEFLFLWLAKGRAADCFKCIVLAGFFNKKTASIKLSYISLDIITQSAAFSR